MCLTLLEQTKPPPPRMEDRDIQTALSWELGEMVAPPNHDRFKPYKQKLRVVYNPDNFNGSLSCNRLP